MPNSRAPDLKLPGRLKLPENPPRIWPRFRSPLHSPPVIARVGRILGICFAICFVTGVLSHYQYQPWTWLPEPAAPKWGYRLTQGVHVITGIATIPLLLVKLSAVYPKLFEWPPARSVLHLLERLSIFVLISSALVELVTGFFNVLDWYPWPWDFVPVHRFLGYVVIGSLAVHIAVKLPIIKAGLATKVWGEGPGVLMADATAVHPAAIANAGAPSSDAAGDGGADDSTRAELNAPAEDDREPEAAGLSRRGLLIAAGAGVGIVTLTIAGQTVGPLEPIALLAPRLPEDGPFGVPINRTAAEAKIARSTVSDSWALTVSGPTPYSLSLAELEALPADEALFPIACVEGWSVNAQWRGPSLLDVVRKAGGDEGSRVEVRSLEKSGSYRTSIVDTPQLGYALLATHINGYRLTLDHGYPVRLIAPNRAGVFNTKWLTEVVVL